ncbi:MAG: hypothetical protein LBU26_02415 [Synergistaceae bacterium]|nr:hypothetical protein [Synergistaceae bacterium]
MFAETVRTFRKINLIFSILFLVISLSLFASARCEALSDAEMALKLTQKLGSEFEPESMSVRVAGSRAFAEARGIFLSGVRIDRLQIEAILSGSDVPEDGNVESLASLIGYSWGEIELLASDINEYFKSNEARGFTDLSVRFSPGGFRAAGVFTKSLLFTFRIRLSATGNFGLRPDGVYIEDPNVYIENLRQPGFLVNEMIERANPLIEWSEIPFKVVFKEIKMTDYSAVMTGGPREFSGGAVAVWNAADRKADVK